MRKFTSYQIRFLIGFVSGSCAIVPLLVLRVDASMLDVISRWSAAQYGIKADAQEEPLPVPQNTLPPVGRGSGSSIPPCAAPPPTMASVPISEETRSSLEQFHPPRDEDSEPPSSPVPIKTGGYKERRTKILMGTASGNLTASLVKRVGLADEQIDAVTSYYYTEDGTISLITNELGDRVVSIQLVPYQ